MKDGRKGNVTSTALFVLRQLERNLLRFHLCVVMAFYSFEVLCAIMFFI